MHATNAAPPSPVPAIEVIDLVKDFPVGLRAVKLRAVDRLTLRIGAGQIFGLLGPNGSGKSTTIKAILGLIEPTLGECRVFGVPSANVKSRRAIGYLPESPNFYRHLTGRELVRFYARLCGLRAPQLQSRVAAALATVDLTAAADRRVGAYSKGMLQRIGLAQAIVHEPQLLILDEPTAGVDPAGAAAIGRLILRLKDEGKTILITSHLLAQMEDLCDRVAILDRGRLKAEGTVDELTDRAGETCVAIDGLPAGEIAALRAWVAARGGSVTPCSPPRARLDRFFFARADAEKVSEAVAPRS